MTSTLIRQNNETVDAEYEIIEITEQKKRELMDEIVAKLRILNGYRNQSSNDSSLQKWGTGHLQS